MSCSSQVELLQSSRPRDRWKAADKLGRRGRGSDEVVAALLLCAQDEDDDVRCSAARALGHAGNLGFWNGLARSPIE